MSLVDIAEVMTNALPAIWDFIGWYLPSLFFVVGITPSARQRETIGSPVMDIPTIKWLSLKRKR
jgi:hypothetical protein